MQMEERKYPALNAVAVLLRVLAVIVAVVGIISAIATPFTLAASFLTVVSTIIGILLSTAISVLVLYAVAELILVVEDIEHNTFQTSRQIQRGAMMAEEERRKAA